METSIGSFSPLVLAYAGDAVIELLAREKLVKTCPAQLSTLNEMCRKYVTAVNQSAASVKAESLFTEEEAAIFRRGKNTRIHSTPRSTDVKDYHRATGLEAVFGFLYLSGNTERARELFDAIYQ
jgi:ribonuclease-3 family protein